MKLKHGDFIVFEGADGCGKTTTIHDLTRLLDNDGLSYIVTKEPGGTKYGRYVRSLLLHADLQKYPLSDLFKNIMESTGMDKKTAVQIQYILMAREDHLERAIIPVLKRHELIICDRYVLSNMAYQGRYNQHGHDKNHILWLNRHLLPDFIWPDLNVYLQAKPEYNIQRLSGRSQKSDCFDRSLHNVNKLKHLQWQYRCALKDLGTPYLFVNANRNANERAWYIHKRILKMIKEENAQ